MSDNSNKDNSFITVFSMNPRLSFANVFDIFKNFGTIIYIHRFYNPKFNRPLPRYFICYLSPKSAEAAIKHMNNTVYHTYQLQVNYSTLSGGGNVDRMVMNNIRTSDIQIYKPYNELDPKNNPILNRINRSTHQNNEKSSDEHIKKSNHIKESKSDSPKKETIIENEHSDTINQHNESQMNQIEHHSSLNSIEEKQKESNSPRENLNTNSHSSEEQEVSRKRVYDSTEQSKKVYSDEFYNSVMLNYKYYMFPKYKHIPSNTSEIEKPQKTRFGILDEETYQQEYEIPNRIITEYLENQNKKEDISNISNVPKESELNESENINTEEKEKNEDTNELSNLKEDNSRVQLNNPTNIDIDDSDVLKQSSFKEEVIYDSAEENIDLSIDMEYTSSNANQDENQKNDSQSKSSENPQEDSTKQTEEQSTVKQNSLSQIKQSYKRYNNGQRFNNITSYSNRNYNQQSRNRNYSNHYKNNRDRIVTYSTNNNKNNYNSNTNNRYRNTSSKRF